MTDFRIYRLAKVENDVLTGAMSPMLAGKTMAGVMDAHMIALARVVFDDATHQPMDKPGEYDTLLIGTAEGTEMLLIDMGGSILPVAMRFLVTKETLVKREGTTECRIQEADDDVINRIFDAVEERPDLLYSGRFVQEFRAKLAQNNDNVV